MKQKLLFYDLIPIIIQVILLPFWGPLDENYYGLGVLFVQFMTMLVTVITPVYLIITNIEYIKEAKVSRFFCLLLMMIVLVILGEVVHYYNWRNSEYYCYLDDISNYIYGLMTQTSLIILVLSWTGVYILNKTRKIITKSNIWIYNLVPLIIQIIILPLSTIIDYHLGDLIMFFEVVFIMFVVPIYLIYIQCISKSKYFIGLITMIAIIFLNCFVVYIMFKELFIQEILVPGSVLVLTISWSIICFANNITKRVKKDDCNLAAR